MSNDSWIYQGNGRGTSQYIKELWARLIQKKMGCPSANGIYVHLFLNGMYWGLYTISERINDDFCKTHFGGDKEDYDVVKMSEVNKRMEASDGSIDKWNEMVSLAEKAADNQFYFKLIGMNGAEPLLDVDNFIDYMLINQYSGNEDWDNHNWTAIRNRKRAVKGFQFLVWDAECIFRNDNFNALNIYYNGCTTHIFSCLMQNAIFRHRYVDRIYKHLVDEGGLLTEEPVVELWDSLYNDISLALYAESARWGDYRRDVHPYYSKGELYTPETYEKTRNKFLTEYFPKRTSIFLQQLIDKGWYPKTPPPVFLVNGEECQSDTLTFNDMLTLSGSPVVIYTLDGSDPVSWIYSSSGKQAKSAISYQPSTNILDKLPQYNGWVTLKAIVQSVQGWSPTVERSFYVTKTTGNRLPTTDFARTKDVYDLSGRRVEKIH